MPAKTAQTTPQRPLHICIEHTFFLTLRGLVVVSVFIGLAHTYFLAGKLLSCRTPHWDTQLSWTES